MWKWSEWVEKDTPHKAESAVGPKRLPAAHHYLFCMTTIALVERDGTLTEATVMSLVIFSRIKDAMCS